MDFAAESSFLPARLIPDNDPETIWKELNLGSLLEDSKRSIMDTLFYQRQLESLHQPAILKHEKMLKKPGFNVLMDRYQSNPTDPVLCTKNKLDKLADPLRGKYAHFDEILSDDNVADNSNINQSPSQKYALKSIRSPFKKSPIKVASDAGGFFLTGLDDVEENEGSDEYTSKNYAKRLEDIAKMEDHVLSRVRRRLEEAAKIESYVVDPRDGGGRGRMRENHNAKQQALAKSRTKALGRGEAAPRIPAKKKNTGGLKNPVPVKARPAWEDPLAKKYPKGAGDAGTAIGGHRYYKKQPTDGGGGGGEGAAAVSGGANGRRVLAPVKGGGGRGESEEREERGFVGRLAARVRATDGGGGNPQHGSGRGRLNNNNNNNVLLKKKAAQSLLARAGRALRENDPLSRTVRGSSNRDGGGGGIRVGSSDAAAEIVDENALDDSLQHHHRGLTRNKSTVNLHQHHRAMNNHNNNKRSSSRSAPSLLKGLLRVNEDPAKKMMMDDKSKKNKQGADSSSSYSRGVTNNNYNLRTSASLSSSLTKVVSGPSSLADGYPVSSTKAAAAPVVGTSVSIRYAEQGEEYSGGGGGGSGAVAAPGVRRRVSGYGSGNGYTDATTGNSSGSGDSKRNSTSQLAGQVKLQSQQSQAQQVQQVRGHPVVIARPTSELIESLKRVEESEAGRAGAGGSNGAEAKLAAELLKRATRIGDTLAAAQSFAEKYKRIDIDAIDDDES